MLYKRLEKGRKIKKEGKDRKENQSLFVEKGGKHVKLRNAVV